MTKTANFVEEWQIKYIYAAVYATVGLVDGVQVSRINDYAIKCLPALKKEYGRLKSLDKSWTSHARFAKRIPKLSDVIKVFEQTVARCGDKQKVLNKFRWILRDEGDAIIYRYIVAYGSTTKAVRKLGEGLVRQLTVANAQLELCRGEKYYSSKDPAYVKQYKRNTYMLMGKDKSGGPFVVSRLRYHNPKGQSKEASNRLVLMLLEHSLLASPDKSHGGTIVWDLQGYKTSNRDYGMISFLSDCASKCYPGIADRLIYYKAPKIFELGWSIVQSLTDVQFRQRVMFINKPEDLLKFIPADQLPRFMGGNSQYDARQWTDPSPQDDLYIKEKETRDDLLGERVELLKQFEIKTVEWILDEGESLQQRQKLADQLKQNYWTLDPYVRYRTIWDRHGTMGICRDELAKGGLAQPTCMVSRPHYETTLKNPDFSVGKLDDPASSASTVQISRTSLSTTTSEELLDIAKLTV